MKRKTAISRFVQTANDEKGRCDELGAKRNLLFERFLKNPLDTRLALEIKIIDDQVAECTQQMDQKRGRRN